MANEHDHKPQELYIDGIGNITFIGGVIRADLVTYSVEKKDEKGNPALMTKQHIILSPQGFVQSATAINNLMKKMIDAGIISQKQSENIESKSQKK